MADENRTAMNGTSGPLKPAASRIAQIGKTLKSVPFMGDKKKPAVQKRPAPVLPSEARAASEKPLELNLYATAMARGEVLIHLTYSYSALSQAVNSIAIIRMHQLLWGQSTNTRQCACT